MKLELQNVITNLRTLSASKSRVCSQNISTASLSCHILLRKGIFPAKRKHTGRSQDSEIAPLGFFLFLFHFLLLLLPFTQVLEIAPKSGVVQPGESVPCFVTLQPTRNPYFCRINLACEVRPRGTCVLPWPGHVIVVPKWLTPALSCLLLLAERILLTHFSHTLLTPEDTQLHPS